MEILTSQMGCAVEVLGKAGARPRDLAAIGITNQRETVIVWDRATGKPIHPAIVWQDRRTAAPAASFEESGVGRTTVSNRTGLGHRSLFLRHQGCAGFSTTSPARAPAPNSGELAFGTVDSWLIWHLTSGHRHVTDVTNASRTLLYNIVKGEWDPELLRIFNIPASLLPEVVWSSEHVGEVTTTLGLGGVPIAGIAGDQQAALFGQLCWNSGEAKNTYGTGCFLLQNIGDPVHPLEAQASSPPSPPAASSASNTPSRAAFSSAARSCSGCATTSSLIGSSAEVEALAAGVPDTGGVVFVPAFVGLGAPHWDPHAGGHDHRPPPRHPPRPHRPRRPGKHRLPGCRRP